MSILSRSASFGSQGLFAGMVTALLMLLGWQFPYAEMGLWRNSVQLGLASLLVAMPIAAVLAVILTRCRIPLRAELEACLLMLLFVPLYIQLAAWEAGFGRGGWYSLLITEKLSHPPLDGFRGAAWIHAVAAVPWTYWMLRLGLSSIPSTYVDAASLDATPWQVFRRIVVPLALPAFLAGAFYVLIVTATEITVTDRYQYRSYAEVLYNEFVLNTRFEELPLSVLPITGTMVFVIVLGLACWRLLWPGFVHATVTRQAAALGPLHWPAFGIALALVSLLVVLPLGNLLYQAGIEVQQVGQQRERFWSITKAVTICMRSPQVYAQELAWTAVMAQLSTLTAIAMATAWGWWSLSSRFGHLFGIAISVICFVTPGPLIGLSLIWLLNRSSPAFVGMLYDDTIFAPCLALTIRCFPFAYLLVTLAFKSIPQVILDASKTDGASSLRGLWLVALPLIRSSLACAVIVCLAVCVGELSAIILVLPPGVSTVSSRIFNLIHYGAEDELAGLCLTCLACMTALSCLAYATIHRSAWRSTKRTGIRYIY